MDQKQSVESRRFAGFMCIIGVLAFIALFLFTVWRMEHRAQTRYEQSVMLNASIRSAVQHKYGNQLESFTDWNDPDYHNIIDVKVLLNNGKSVQVQYNADTKQLFGSE